MEIKQAIEWAWNDMDNRCDIFTHANVWNGEARNKALMAIEEGHPKGKVLTDLIAKIHRDVNEAMILLAEIENDVNTEGEE